MSVDQIRQDLKPAKKSQTPLLDAARAELSGKTPLCIQMAADRSEVVNGAMAASGEAPPAIFVDRNDGARFTDLDGNVYVDTCMGFGVHVLGHRHPIIEKALADQLDRGWHFSLRCPQQLDYAQLVRQAGPNNDRVVFCNSGTEATHYAFRAARAFTGKRKIALFSNAYHGAHDQVLIWPSPDSTPEYLNKMIVGAGVPREMSELAILLPFRNERAFDVIRANASELAAVIVEPVQGSFPHPDVGAFLKELSAVCSETGVLLIADEVLTGFRLAYGGGQATFGFDADLSTYGKAAAGGLPVGIVAGRSDVMEVFGDFTQPRGIFFSGTFSGNPLSMAAGNAFLGHLRENPKVFDDINAKGERLRSTFNAYTSEHSYPVEMLGYGSLYQLFFAVEGAGILSDFSYAGRQAESAFYLHLLNRGVFIHATHRCFVSAAHSEEDITMIVGACIAALEDCRTDGLM